MKIGYLGAGAWGIALANVLAERGHQVVVWTIEEEVIDYIEKNRAHPRFPSIPLHEGIEMSPTIEGTIEGAEWIVESVTAKGLRPTLHVLKEMGGVQVPFILTSKGIEQGTSLLLPEVVLDVLGEEARPLIGCLSGPSLAREVMEGVPTSVVAASFSSDLKQKIAGLFTAPEFRVYPNGDIIGVSFGGAMKNIIAIACGICDALELGNNAKAALMTRGLHEIRKLSALKGALPTTLNGLSGLGDLCVTCLSPLSRNYSFGRLVAKGAGEGGAKEEIGMVVEGAYTCIAALQLAKKGNISLPITEAVHSIVYGGIDPTQAVQELLSLPITGEEE